MGKLSYEEIKNQLETIKYIKSFIKDDNNKPDDSVITILGKKFHDENAISDYLAYILDPEVNGVGHEPLIRFLKLIGRPIELSDSDDVYIQREYLLDNNRRIDFLIEINEEHIIAIEHKVFSSEHGDQTVDYEKEINQSFSDKAEDIQYVFLSPGGRKAINPHFISVSYADLVFLLKQTKIDFTKDIRKAVLFNEIIFHLEGYFLSNKGIKLSEESRLYIDYFKTINDLTNKFEEDFKRILTYIESVIKNYFNNNIGGTEWKVDFSEKRSYHQIFRPHWKTKELDIHFEVKFDQRRLVNGELFFLLDVEGNKKDVFKKHQDHRLREGLQDVMDRNEILYRKGKRKDTFASKTYNFLNYNNLEDENTIEENILQMINEFEDFIEPIENEIEHFNLNHRNS